LGSPPAEDIDQPGETDPVAAAFTVIQDMMALKYGVQLDEHDFISKAKVRCSPEERLSPLKFATALNGEPALKLKDSSSEHLVQLRLNAIVVTTFQELQGFIRRWPGTACALAAVSLGGTSGKNAQLIAAFREAYGKTDSVVGKAKAKTQGKISPLYSFSEEQFHGAVVLEPIVDRVLKYEMETQLMIDLNLPAESAEFADAAKTQDAEVLLGSRAVGVIADLAAGSSSTWEKGATASCLLAKELMLRHPKAAELQVAACRTLGGHLPTCRRSLHDEHAGAAVEAVMAAMRRHSSKCEIQEAACSAIAGATASWPDLQMAAATNGAAEQIVSAMRRFPENAELQSVACGAFAGLAANHPLNQSAIAGSRGIEVIAYAMEKYADHAGLQTMACGAFGNLSANHPNNQAAIASSGGLQRVVAAMRRHPQHPAVLTSAMGALWCLVKRNPDNLALASKLGAAELAVAAVQHHQSDRALRSMASGALQCLVPGLGNAMSAGPSGESVVSSARSTAQARPGQTPRVTQ